MEQVLGEEGVSGNVLEKLGRQGRVREVKETGSMLGCSALH